MFRENICLKCAFRIPGEDRAEVCGDLYLHRKGMKLLEIVAELAPVSHEEVFDENRIKYWLHELKLHHFDLR
jgi:hypothetical protein